MNNSKFKGKLSSALLASIGLAAIIVIWWLAVKFTEIGLLLPSPLDVLERIIYNCSHPIGRKFTLPVHLLISLRRVLLGFTVASVAGVILGIAMGTSEAGGYVDEKGYITGWLNELAFIPVDANPGALRDEWSLDIGCGVKYFSQDGVIKLAPVAGIELDGALSPAEKLKAVQALMNDGDERAAAIYRSIGVYLAHSLALYHDMYHFRHVLLLGRVMSGRGGELIISECERVLRDEYSELAEKIHLALPDEKFRRVGQSAAAASLPELRK